jgi:nucleoside 2-deoxyribosyltransferase
MTAPAKLSAFVLMPFDASFEDVYRFGIKATVEEHGMNAARVDEQVFHHEGILERIRNQVDAADFIIADVSSKNPNVFCAIGYAHAKQKTTILLTTDAADIPFDLRHRRATSFTAVPFLYSNRNLPLTSLK